jgi:hypothetical protein
LGELKTPAAVMRAVQGARNPQRKSGSEKETLRQPKISAGKTGSHQWQMKAHNREGTNTKSENQKSSP